jgi:hypothetical protein
VEISIDHPNNNFAYNNSTTIPINKVIGKRCKITTKECISVIEKKFGGKKLPRNCRNNRDIEVPSSRNREEMKR